MISNSIHGLVLGGHNGLYQVQTDKGIILCHSATKIRKDGWKLMAGDSVTITLNDDNTGFVQAVDERTNMLIRPPVANIGLLVIVVAAANPDPMPFTIDKLTVIAEKQKIPLVLAITKSELSQDPFLDSIYTKTPYPLFHIYNRGENGADGLRKMMDGKITVFCGASGVGKSSLLNFLFPSLQLEVGELSKKIQRGKNTTRVTYLREIAPGSYIADTPGFTSLDTGMYIQIKKEDLCQLFPEMRELVGTCKYTHCTHLCEDGCSIVQAVQDGTIARERHNSYCTLYKELKSNPIYK